MTRVPVVLLLSVLALACGAGTSSQGVVTPTLLAEAGSDQAVASGAAVTLDGTASRDSAGAALTYAWTQVSGPAVSLSSASAASPTFRAPPIAAGQPAAILVFSLVVSDARGTVSPPATVTVTVSPAAPVNRPPVADAGANQSVASGATGVALDGSRSSGSAGALTYAWSEVSGPPVTLAAATSARATFDAPVVPSGAPPATLVFALVVSDASGTSLPSTVTVVVNAEGAVVDPPPPGTPPPATGAPLPVGASGAHGKGIRFEVGTFLGLYLVDPAAGEPNVQGWVNVTYGPISSGNFIPPADTTVTLNGVPLLRDPALNGSFWRVDPAGPQPVVGSGGQLVIVATARPPGQATPDVRTLVLPCAADVQVSSSPAVGAAIAAGSAVHLTSPSDLTLNLPTNFVPLRGDVPQVRFYGYDPATRALSAAGNVANLPPGPLDVTLPVPATAARAYLVDLRWPGLALPDGETGGFCGLVKRWTYAR